MDPQDAIQAVHAIALAALNGVIALTGALNISKTLSAGQVQHVFQAITKPFDHPSFSGDPLIQDALANIQNLFGAMTKQ